MRSGPDFVVARLSSISIRRPIGLIKGRYWSCVASRRWCLTLSHGRSGLFSYAAINLDGADVQIREQPRQGLGRNEVAIGDVVGFLDRNQQERNGRIVRLNDKTVTLLCGQQQWRVAYRVEPFSGVPRCTMAGIPIALRTICSHWRRNGCMRCAADILHRALFEQFIASHDKATDELIQN